MEEAGHRPVMVDEVVRLLGGRDVVLDLTLGAGGHAEALLAAGAGRVIGVDRDPAAVELAAARLSRFGDRFHAVLARFAEVPAAGGRGPREASPGGVSGAPRWPDRVDGVLYDLGVSSMQLDAPERGFSYRRPGPLDMRMGREGGSAMDLVNTASERELARIVFEFGEERRSRRVAAAIVRARERAPITTTDELARVVAGAVGARRGGPHPARRTFQALRIAVNRELEELAASLPRAADLLAPGGRLVAISYHSLEDRLVKRFLVERDDLDPLRKKPLTPSSTERARNPRSRSAKLRAAEKKEAA
ncbi:MAG TPA: 16S rRNA (cytosine(1402)-N(4))-methyltransferase RsmH [Actinomycetota bacterium]